MEETRKQEYMKFLCEKIVTRTGGYHTKLNNQLHQYDDYLSKNNILKSGANIHLKDRYVEELLREYFPDIFTLINNVIKNLNLALNDSDWTNIENYIISNGNSILRTYEEKRNMLKESLCIPCDDSIMAMFYSNVKGFAHEKVQELILLAKERDNTTEVNLAKQSLEIAKESMKFTKKAYNAAIVSGILAFLGIIVSIIIA